MRALLMMLLMVAAVLLALLEIYQRLRLVRLGRPDVRWDRWPRRIRRFFRVVLGQSKLLRRGVRGTMHLAFFWGFLILQTVSLQVIGEGIGGHHFRLPVIGGSKALSLLQELTSLAVLFAILIALYNRYFSGNPHIRAKSQFDALFILVGIALLMATFFVTNGWLMNEGQPFAREVMPVSRGMGYLLAGLPQGITLPPHHRTAQRLFSGKG
jgi:hypothetical protein